MIGHNSTSKAGMVDRQYSSLWYSDELTKRANEFYERIKEKPTNMLKIYDRMVEPRGFIDGLKYLLNSRRRVRHAAVERVLFERKLEEKLTEQ